MQNTGLDIKKILKRESRFIISDMIKNNRISIFGYFNKFSASLIYLNYSDPDFRSKNNISKWNKIRSLSNIDTNLNIISAYTSWVDLPPPNLRTLFSIMYNVFRLILFLLHLVL